MLTRFLKLYQRKETVSPQRSEADATKYLNNLRENELSLGAAMRRGERVMTAPKQAKIAVPAAATGGTAPRPSPQPVATRPPPPAQPAATSEHFGTSMAIGFATGSGALGYIAGGSLAGGAIGAALAEAADGSAVAQNLGE